MLHAPICTLTILVHLEAMVSELSFGVGGAKFLPWTCKKEKYVLMSIFSVFFTALGKRMWSWAMVPSWIPIMFGILLFGGFYTF